MSYTVLACIFAMCGILIPVDKMTKRLMLNWLCVDTMYTLYSAVIKRHRSKSFHSIVGINIYKRFFFIFL